MPATSMVARWRKSETAAGEREEMPRASLAPELTALVPLPGPQSPGPALAHEHMAFSIVAPYPQATAIAVRVAGSRLHFISNCRRHSLAGRTRVAEIIHHTPLLPFPSIFLSGLAVAAARFASSAISRMWRANHQCVFACTPSIRIPNYSAALGRRRSLFTLRYMAQASSLIDSDAEAGVINFNCQTCQRLFCVGPVRLQVV